MLEMLVSITIIVLLMSAVFPFLFQAQKRFQGNVVVSESNQSARAALEVMSQEIGQAGYNPTFSDAKNATNAPVSLGVNQCITLNNIDGIHTGDFVSVDTGPNNELVKVVSTSNAQSTSCSPAPATQIQGVFLKNHVVPYPVASYKMPFPSGILIRLTSTGALDTTTAPVYSTYHELKFYGDINEDTTQGINYVVYSIAEMSPTTDVTIPPRAGDTCNPTGTYRLYNLYRSNTPVPFVTLGTAFTPACPGPACNNQASPMVEKVMYNLTCEEGPTGKPIFDVPSAVVTGVVPNVITVVGTVVITLSVAVNPKSLESSQVQWFTMATQIRPLNLASAVNANSAGAGPYMSLLPATLPMAVPSNYYP
jgi:type II secretory pathway pseudopilin PulG